MAVEQAELLERHLLEAVDVAGVLTVACEIFDFVETLAAASVDQVSDLYPAFTFARGLAASGRNAVALAPSLSPGSPARPGNLEVPAGDIDEIADAIAELASALSSRLRVAAGLAADADDQAACEDAAHSADRIGELLAGGV